MQPITCEIRSLPPVFIMHLEDTGVLLLTWALPSSQERNSFQYSHPCVRSAHCTGLSDCKATCVPSADILKRTPTTAGARKVRSKLHECSSHMNPFSSAKTRDNQSTYIHDTVTLGGLGMSLVPQQRTSTVGKWPGFSLLTTSLERAQGSPPQRVWARRGTTPRHWGYAVASSCGTSNANKPTSLARGPHSLTTFFFLCPGLLFYYALHNQSFPRSLYFSYLTPVFLRTGL